MKPNEKHNIEDAISEEKIIDILRNIQNEPITCSKVSCVLKLVVDIYNFM